MMLVSFADSRYRSSLRRLGRQAWRSGLYGEVLLLDESDLSESFAQRNRTILTPDCRGYGYWIWKPQVILQAMASARPGQIVNYLDAGFHINPRGRSRLKEYQLSAATSPTGVFGFKSVPPFGGPLAWDGRELPVWKNCEWTKSALLERFGMQNNYNFLQDVTYEAGAIFLRNCQASVRFVQEWLSVMEEDEALIDDSISPGGEAEYFREHRHDQAVYNILAYTHNVPYASSREFWYKTKDGKSVDWRALRRLPLHARRLPPPLRTRVILLIARTYRRLRRVLRNLRKITRTMGSQ